MNSVDHSRPWFVDAADGSEIGFGELYDALRNGISLCRNTEEHQGVGAVLLRLASAIGRGEDVLLEEGSIRTDSGLFAGLDPNLGFTSTLDRLFQNPRGTVSLLTSGATGQPKRVTHTWARLLQTVRRGPTHRGDVWGFCYNPFHIAGVQVFLQALFNENSMVGLYGAAPDVVRGRLQTSGITHLSATPTFYRLLMDDESVFTEIRSVTVGGERSDESLIRQLRRVFPNARLRNVYASTEAGTVLTAEGDVFRVPSTFRDRVTVEEQQLLIHSSLLGQFDQASNTGWYATQDLVEVLCSDPLTFRFVSRSGDSLNVGGEKINPGEVETYLRQHPAVLEARVYGRANAVTGTLICADVRLRAGQEGVSEKSLREAIALQLPAYKIPRLIRFVESIMTTRSGKLKR